MPNSTQAKTILDIAGEVTSTHRNQDYGSPLTNHGRTARFWSAFLGADITPEQVCMMNILQKISRGMNKITQDTLVDIAGYARNVEMIQDEKHTLEQLEDE